MTTDLLTELIPGLVPAAPPVSAFTALEVVGTVAFAVSGAAVAVRVGMDWLGVAVLAVVTAIGGGSLRDALVGQGPARWVEDPSPIAVALGTAGAVIAVAHRAPGVHVDSWRSFVVADAAGLAAFTISGTQLSLAAGIGAPVAVLLGVVTGTGGGVLRDVLAGQRPLVLTADVYALAALAGAVCVPVLSRYQGPDGVARWVGVALVLVVRLAAVRWQWSLPRFTVTNPSDTQPGAAFRSMEEASVHWSDVQAVDPPPSDH